MGVLQLSSSVHFCNTLKRGDSSQGSSGLFELYFSSQLHTRLLHSPLSSSRTSSVSSPSIQYLRVCERFERESVQRVRELYLRCFLSLHIFQDFQTERLGHIGSRRVRSSPSSLDFSHLSLLREMSHSDCLGESERSNDER